MIDSENAAIDIVEKIQEKKGLYEQYDPGNMGPGIYEAWKESSTNLKDLAENHNCSYPIVRAFLYSVVSGESAARILDNAALYAMHALARDSIADPNVQNLFKKVYEKSPDSGLGREAKGHMLRAGISFDDKAL